MSNVNRDGGSCGNGVDGWQTMCTLIVLHRCVAGRPLVVAANRDEFLDRPAEDMALRSSRTGPILSPLDLEAGGTWVGLSQRGVFAGLTNLRPLEERPLEERPHQEEEGSSNQRVVGQEPLRSRGGVVMAALEAENAAEAVRALSQLEEAAYNPFQLLVADGRDAWLIVYRDRPQAIELEPGAHVVGNVEDERIAAVLGTTGILERQASGSQRRSGGTEFPGFEGVEGLIDSEEPRVLKLTRIRERVEKMVTEPGIDLFEGLARVCREHVDDEGIQNPLEATCVHIADRYGTRSSLLLELSEQPDASRMWTTDGPPCERPFDNRSPLLKDLFEQKRA
ncbi:MAG: NRDE family protein [bacterium]|nr:NRDE family protein [bacterium]